MNLLDLSYVEEVLTQEEAAAILREQLPSRHGREEVLSRGYPGYDTSLGWFQYEDNQVKACSIAGPARSARERSSCALRSIYNRMTRTPKKL